MIALRIVTALLVVGTVFGLVSSDTGTENTPNMTTVTAVTEDSMTVEYRDGSWWTDSVRVSLDCPTEDSCDVDYRDGAWHVTRVTP